MTRARALASALALVTFWVTLGAHAECTKDIDCAGELYCEQGKCVEAAPAVAAAPQPAPEEPRGAAPRARATAAEPPPVEAPPQLERRSTGLVVVGAAAVVGGVVGLLVGLGSMGSTCHRDLADDFTIEHCERSPNYLAYGLGGGALVAGAGLIAIGAQKVPVEPVASITPWLSKQGGGLAFALWL